MSAFNAGLDFKLRGFLLSIDISDLSLTIYIS